MDVATSAATGVDFEGVGAFIEGSFTGPSFFSFFFCTQSLPGLLAVLFTFFLFENMFIYENLAFRLPQIHNHALQKALPLSLSLSFLTTLIPLCKWHQTHKHTCYFHMYCLNFHTIQKQQQQKKKMFQTL